MAEDVFNVVSYIRESTVGQRLNGYRPEAQRDDIKRYCERHHFNIVQEFEDSGSGGGIKNRPRFIEMINFVKNHQDIKFIVIAETSRFFRNLQSTLNFEHELEDKHRIFAIDTWIDHDPRSYFERGISPAQWANRMNARVRAEEERRYIQVTVRQGYKTKSSHAMYVGPVAFGLEWKDVHKKYIGYHRQESKIVLEVFKMYLTGQYGFRKLARYLNEQGFQRMEIERKEKTLGGGRVLERNPVGMSFTLESIRSMLKNKSYIGRQNTPPNLPLLTLDDNNNAVPLRPLVSEDMFNRVQEMMRQNRRGGSATGVKETSRQKRVFLLQGIGYSGINGAKIHGHTETGSSKEPVRRYFPSTNKSGNASKIPSMRAVEEFSNTTRRNAGAVLGLVLPSRES